ncbi:MAG: DNA translocase FtsK [Acidobacteria bacterium]|nr:DNA translocase FtsK [Acidobacteriota bacterium]
MSRILSVSEIRRNLHRVLPVSRPESPVTPFLGQAFHEIFGKLTGSDPALNFVRPLGDASASLADMTSGLRAHAYRLLVAPLLLANRQMLSGQGAAVLEFWRAVESLCGWIVALSDADRAPGRTLEEFRSEIFQDHEREVEREIHEPGWKVSVLLKGRIDALFRNPVTGNLCVGEIKLGAGVPELDLCQAALYRLALGGRGPRRQLGPEPDVVLIHFGGERHEAVYRAAQLAELEGRLKDLIGALAGVADASPVSTSDERLVFPVPPAWEDLRHQVRRLYEGASVPLKFSPEILAGPSHIRLLATAGKGVNEAQIRKVTENLWLALKLNFRAQYSIVKGEVAIDLPRTDPQPVWWRDLERFLPARSPFSVSKFPAGVAVDGRLRWVDLAAPESAHFLVAGTSGSGKSEWLRSIVASLLSANTPETLKLVLIDPKRTAFGCLEGSAFLERPVVHPEDTPVLEILDELIQEMEARFRILSEEGVSETGELEERIGKAPYPRIVCVCDEFFDLVAVSARMRQHVEMRLSRLAGKARASGIHLVFATQRPSKSVVTGTIKANLTGRVAFRVTDWRESSIILDRRGAEHLAGRGDLFLLVTGEPERLQSPLVTTEELRQLGGA